MDRSETGSGMPLGRDLPMPRDYAPGVLYPIRRQEARQASGIPAALPFAGVDIWNAWELAWLDPDGRPQTATARIRVPADSGNLIESKSLKLYLNSFAFTRYGDAAELGSIIRRDLSAAAAGEVTVEIAGPAAWPHAPLRELPGVCIDAVPGRFVYAPVDASRLATAGPEVVEEELHSHLLRSNCPVTGQPDTGSVLVRYRGRRIDRAGLLEYVVSYREHDAFHEACVERMFVDIRERCGTERLTVMARYTRRGGIDINPFRSDYEADADDLRLWRQ